MGDGAGLRTTGAGIENFDGSEAMTSCQDGDCCQIKTILLQAAEELQGIHSIGVVI
jgi:hypothetical protein